MSDYRMPGINGGEFLSRVCIQWPDTVRILLSGYPDTAAVVDAVNNGQIYKFIPKPWNDEEIRTTIENALERYRLSAASTCLTKSLKKLIEELKDMNEKMELFIKEVVSELSVQNLMQHGAQETLDGLPTGVVRIDAAGIVVQMNKMAQKILQKNGKSMIGRDRHDVLPTFMNEFVDEIFEKDSSAKHIILSGIPMRIRGALLGEYSSSKDIAITIDREV